MATSAPFRNARWQTKVLHLLESTNVPDTFLDWDEDGEEVKKTPEEYKSRWKSVLKETTGMIVLQLLSNMLVPILVTGEIHDFISVEKSFYQLQRQT